MYTARKETTDSLLFCAGRSNLGLTLREMANQLGISRYTVRSIEQGRIVPSPRVLTRFLELFAGETQQRWKGWLDTFDADYCRDVRKRLLKMSQRRFAQTLGVSPGLIGVVESGHQKMTPALKKKIDEALDFHLPSKRACGLILDMEEFLDHKCSVCHATLSN